MSKHIVIAIAAVLLLASAAAGERIELDKIPGDISVSVLESNNSHIVIQYRIGAFHRNPVEIDHQLYYDLSLAGENLRTTAGEPALPEISRSIVIPDDASMRATVISSDYVELPTTPVTPSKGILLRTVNPDDVPYEFGPVYQSDAWFPSSVVVTGQPFILRDFRGIVVKLTPFQTNPVSGALRIYTSVTVEIVNTGPGEINIFQDRKELRLVPEFDRIYQRRFINYAMATSDKYTPVQESGDMLIITYDAFNSAMQPLVNWKRQKGIPTEMVNVSTIGNNVTAITNYIQNYYNSSNLAWVILVGDENEIVTPYASGGASDPSYAKVAGGDDYPDIFIGRFSATIIDHVATQVTRTIDYELSPYAASWLHKGTGIASNQGPGHYGEYDYVHMNYIRNDLLNFTYTLVDQIYDPSATAAQVTTALNEGRSIVNYCGHGSHTSWTTSGFSNTHVNSLTNNDKLPFIFSVACQNGHFNDGYTCFAEAWLRATNGGSPSGAVATYMSSVNQSWSPPMEAQDEANDLLVTEAMTTFGGICYNGSCRMIDVYTSGGVAMYNTWHIFGDPSVQLRTDVPTAMTVNHDPELEPGQASFDVVVVGVAGALCALYDNGVLYGSAYTDAGGSATIPINGTLTEGQTVTLTVTAFNRSTYTASLPVVSGPTSCVAWTSTWGDTLAQHAYWGDRTDDGYVFCGRVGPYDAAILGSDILMVKTDSCGSALWARTYGGDSADFAYSMDVTSPDNGMIICGSTFSFGLGGTDIYIIKTNSSGDVEWTRTLGSSDYDYGEDIKQTSDGGYIVIGQMDGRDILIEKLNASGGTVWSDTCFDFYGFEHYYPGEVIENSSGNFVVSGYGWDDDYDEYFVILFTWDSNGNQTGWHRYYMDHAHGYGLDQTSDGGYIVCGSLADTGGYYSMDILLLKVNSSFNQQWARTYDADRGDAAFSVKQVDNGGYIATGEASHGFYEDYYMYVLRTDNNGDQIWSKELGGAYHDEGQCVNVTPDGGFILTGNSYSFGDSENGDFYMVKLEAEPAAPVLVSPANGQYWYSTGMSVALDWQDAARADYYHVMVDNNSNFSSPVVDVDSLAASDYVTPTLGVSTYYWRVRGENETGYGPWSQVRSFQIRQPSGGGGCPVLFSYDGLGFRRENPLLTACEASGYTEIVTDYYHLNEPVADDDGRVVFRLQEAADEISYIHDLELITVDHAPDVRVACGVNGDIMTYRETIAPVTAVDHNGDDRLAEVAAEDGLLFTANESGHLIVTFPNSFGDLLSFSFTAAKKPIIIIDPEGGDPKVLPGPVASSLRLEVLDDYGQWHEINSDIPSRDNPVSEFVFTELARVLTGDFITLRLSWEGGYTTDALCQYLPSGDTPVIATRNVDDFERIFARPASENWQGFSGDEPLVLRQGDIFEFSFDDAEATTGSERDYIIRAVGRYEPASSALADGLPGKFALHDNYPNPFNPSTTIKYDLPAPMIVKIDIVNILGQVITTLVDGPQTAGSHTITWDGRDRRGNAVASGIYLYRFTSEAYKETKKMLLIK